MMTMLYFFAYFAISSIVGPGIGSAVSHHLLSWLGQKYGPQKISWRQRIWTPRLPASSIIGRCLSIIACLIDSTFAESSLSGLDIWISPPTTVLAIRTTSR